MNRNIKKYFFYTICTVYISIFKITSTVLCFLSDNPACGKYNSIHQITPERQG